MHWKNWLRRRLSSSQKSCDHLPPTIDLNTATQRWDTNAIQLTLLDWSVECLSALSPSLPSIPFSLPTHLSHFTRLHYPSQVSLLLCLAVAAHSSIPLRYLDVSFSQGRRHNYDCSTFFSSFSNAKIFTNTKRTTFTHLVRCETRFHMRRTDLALHNT